MQIYNLKHWYFFIFMKPTFIKNITDIGVTIFLFFCILFTLRRVIFIFKEILQKKVASFPFSISPRGNALNQNSLHLLGFNISQESRSSSSIWHTHTIPLYEGKITVYWLIFTEMSIWEKEVKGSRGSSALSPEREKGVLKEQLASEAVLMFWSPSSKWRSW